MQTNYFKTVLLSLSLCFILNAAYCSNSITPTVIPDTIILGTISGSYYYYPGRYILSFDQNRFMPPGDQMYIEYMIDYGAFCSGSEPWKKLTSDVYPVYYPINWYNDSAANVWRDSGYANIHSSAELYVHGACRFSTITFRIIYLSYSGNQTPYVTISNFSFHLAPTHLDNITTTYSGNACSVPLNASFNVLMHCPECNGSDDIRYEVDFGDGKDTFLIAYVMNSGDFHLIIDHSYNSYGIFNPSFHVYNFHGGGYDTLTLIINQRPPASILTTGPTTFCSGDSVILNAIVQPNNTYQWKKGGVDIPGATAPTYTAMVGGNYKVAVTNSVTGCSRTTGSAFNLTMHTLPNALITPLGPTSFCAGDNVVLKANSGSGLIYKWKKDATFISGANGINYTAFVAGTYKVQVTNSNGCKKTSPGVLVTVPCRMGEEADENNAMLTIFPNPTSGKFTIHSGKQIKELTITNISGQIIYQKYFLANSIDDATGFEMDLTNQPKGIYLIHVVTEDETINKKLIIN